MRRILVRTLCAGFALCSAACGGTSGRELLPSASNPASVDATASDAPTLDGGLDATVGDESIYTGAFNVFIPYADRELPDVQAVPEAGTTTAEAGSGLPNCPPFIPVAFDADGGYVVVPLRTEDDQRPADYTADGGDTFAPDGSTCATYPWLGSVAADDCLASIGTPSYFTSPLLPPCNWAVEAGTAMQGNGAGESRYDLCIAFYQCALRSACFVGSTGDNAKIGDCFCGNDPVLAHCMAPTPGPSGPCVNEILDGLELPRMPVMEAPVVLARLSSFGMNSGPGWPTSELGGVLKQFTYYGCGSQFPGFGDASTGN